METKKMTFGDALEALKQGKKVARQGWNGKDMWLHIANGKHGVSFEFGLYCLGEEKDLVHLPSIVQKTSDNKYLIGWVPSQEDMFSEDWMIIE